MKPKKLSKREREVLAAVAEGRDYFDVQRPTESIEAFKSLVARRLIVGTSFVLTDDGARAYRATRKIRTHLVVRDRFVYLIVTDPTSGHNDRFTTHKIALTGLKKTEVIGRELPFQEALGVVLKDGE